MSKRGSLKHQIMKYMEGRQNYSVSKKEVQLREKERCKAEGIPWNPARVGEKVFSTSSYDNYLNRAIKFGEFIKEKHGINKIEQLLDKEKGMEYGREYIEYYKNAGYAPSTIHTVASGVAKFYDVCNSAFGVKLPPRDSASITRSRKERAHDKELDTKKYANEIEFGKGTGLRKKELSLVTPKQIFERDGRVYIELIKEKYGKQAKHGKDRTLVVRKDYEKHVLKCRDRAISLGQKTVFKEIPNRLDEQALRREYAQNLYREIEKDRNDRGIKTERWYRMRDGSGRKFDKEILKEVNKNLGHGNKDDERAHTAVHHYLT